MIRKGSTSRRTVAARSISVLVLLFHVKSALFTWLSHQVSYVCDPVWQRCSVPLTSIFCFMGTAGHSGAPMLIILSASRTALVRARVRACVFNSVTGYALKQHCLVAWQQPPPPHMSAWTSACSLFTLLCRSRQMLAQGSVRACVCARYCTCACVCGFHRPQTVEWQKRSEEDVLPRTLQQQTGWRAVIQAVAELCCGWILMFLLWISPKTAPLLPPPLFLSFFSSPSPHRPPTCHHNRTNNPIILPWPTSGNIYMMTSRLPTVVPSIISSSRNRRVLSSSYPSVPRWRCCRRIINNARLRRAFCAARRQCLHTQPQSLKNDFKFRSSKN